MTSPVRRRRRPRGDAPKAACAALDLGTNNCRMLVARPSGRSFKVIDSFSRVIRLGEGLSATGRLGEAAIGRALEALGVCAAKIRRRRVARIRGVATEACRRAVNGASFLERIERQTGIVLETVSPREEARLTLAGVAPLLDAALPLAMIFDIGGGSTEVTWIAQSPGRAPRTLGVLSIPSGVVTLAERHGTGLIAADAYAEMVAGIDAGLAPFDAEHGIAGEVAAGRVHMLGTSGTVTMLGGLHLGLERYDRSRVDGLDIDFDSIHAIVGRLKGMDLESRAAHPCIGRQRADLAVAGCAILEALCRRWPVGRLRVADRGIREGLLMSMMGDGR